MKNVKKVKTLINVLHAIQVIIEKNNLTEMPMDNAYVRMVIMMAIKKIVYASNAQHFGIFNFFYFITFFKALFAHIMILIMK